MLIAHMYLVKIDLVFEVVHGPRQAFAGLRMVCKNRTRFACVPNV